MQEQIDHAIETIGSVLYGKERQIRQALTCLFAHGHLLIEDLPGMGKTTLAHALAQVLGLEYQRVQFTSDMLPADLLGVSVFDAASSDFRFHQGPVFTQLLLADEINRTTPKTQSALLEAMEEHQVTLEGATYPLPDPFFVIATQNPLSQYGTFPLPESQLDRFLMRISLGYPDPSVERKLLKGFNPRQGMDQLPAAIDGDGLAVLQDNVTRVFVSDALLDYIQRILAFTRQSNRFNFSSSASLRRHSRRHPIFTDVRKLRWIRPLPPISRSR